MVLLLAGVLHRQGFEGVDSMFQIVLDQLGAKAPLNAKARCAGLLSAVLRDLAPVGYKPEDDRYEAIVRDSMAVFDARQSKGIPIEVAIEAAEAIGQGGDPRFADPKSEQNWVTIPAGDFLMGAQKEDPAGPNYDAEQEYVDESPVRQVHLRTYRIGRYPVTVAEYKRFLDSGGYEHQRHWEGGGFGKWQGPDEWDDQQMHPNRPVVNVSWYEASAYAAWAGCRLPTKAEWERAARGIEGRRYPWGADDPAPSHANYYHDTSVKRLTPVGVYPLGATPEGAVDMAGNVWEWCQDVWHDNYRGAPTDGSAWTTGGEQETRVLRGGSWVDTEFYLRSAYRNRDEPDSRCDYFGFRVAAGT